ncbi:MAG: hypothetical protein NTX17_06710 [Candidatus Eisenbacteria bacterium]|nr:hypothetical protein [Candidatus Eisenbacteria bacterium]
MDEHVTRYIETNFQKMIMSQSPGTRVAMACRMFSTGVALVQAGLRGQTHGRIEDLRPLVFLRLYGHELSSSQRVEILMHFEAS